MRIGLIDVDGHNFPNISLMKLSAWHKSIGDSVEWYSPLFSGHMDCVYMSKVFSFTPDYEHFVDADEVIRGGSGYCIETVDGREIYHKERDHTLPEEVEHIYPDYDLYPELCKDTAYGFLTRGCPRGCNFCHVEAKEGRCSRKVADLSEFWRGQKNIVLCDPNLIACKDWKLPFETLEDEHFLEEIGIPETHIEYKILMDDAFFEHLHLKRIVIDKDIPFPMSTFERMLRYAKYGYFPCKETKMKIINALRDLTDEQVELSESLYDGMD